MVVSEETCMKGHDHGSKYDRTQVVGSSPSSSHRVSASQEEMSNPICPCSLPYQLTGTAPRIRRSRTPRRETTLLEPNQLTETPLRIRIADAHCALSPMYVWLQEMHRTVPRSSLPTYGDHTPHQEETDSPSPHTPSPRPTYGEWSSASGFKECVDQQGAA